MQKGNAPPKLLNHRNHNADRWETAPGKDHTVFGLTFPYSDSTVLSLIISRQSPRILYATLTGEPAQNWYNFGMGGFQKISTFRALKDAPWAPAPNSYSVLCASI